jgi:two-component system phosphate regulon sensor histidine kinase PhoR
MTGGTLALLAVVAVASLYLGHLLGRRGERLAVRASSSNGRDEPPPPPADKISVEALAEPALVVAGDLAVAANAAARRLFGDRVTGSDLRLTVRHPVVLDAIAEARSDHVAVEREISGIGGGNSAWRLHVVDAGEGRVLVLFDDITQTRLTERMRVDFVANASHELRTPLATLSGFIETLQGPAAGDEPARERFLDIMALEAGRMSRLIDDLLSLSRIELDKHVRPVAQLEVPGVIADVRKTLAMRLEADERQLIIDEQGPLPAVIADRDQILQVLHNLVSNALKYGHTGTPITVRASAEPARPGVPAQVRITVIDQGDGISPEHLPRLTERFYRVDSQRSRKMGGTGLGLAIVKHIIERHRGRLDISSQQGEGTTVSFALPQASPESDAVSDRDAAGVTVTKM